MARIVINPSTFKNEKDALCVAFDEGFRIIMEQTGFVPESEPTEAQREFLSDTPYADDERQMRRTILARICTLDTSVSDPTDEQLQEAVSFLESVINGGYCKTSWERKSVERIKDMITSVIAGQGKKSERTPDADLDMGATA